MIKNLKLYATFKNETKPSGFINPVKNPEHKVIASKFRDSLRIETGGFTIPRTPANLRICDHCNLNLVEDETHVLFHGKLYDELRTSIFTKIIKQNRLFESFNNTEKGYFLF